MKRIRIVAIGTKPGKGKVAAKSVGATLKRTGKHMQTVGEALQRPTAADGGPMMPGRKR